MKCKYCGAELIDGTNFCVKCGKNNSEENSGNENQKEIKHRNQAKNNKLFVVMVSIIIAVILIAIAVLIMMCLPPSKKEIEEDALDYANLGSAYSVSDIAVSKTNQDNGFLADVQIEAINKDNNDTNHIQLYIDYFKSGIKYSNNLSRAVESSVCPNHNPTENDLFPLPDIVLEIKDSNETSRCTADDEGITTEIDYEHIVTNEKTADVPLTVGADYVNAKGEVNVTVQYMYEGDYVWSGENVVNVDLKPKYDITEELIREDIKNNTFLYNGYISEELSGMNMESEGSTVQYYDLYNRAEVTTAFGWQNENVKLTGELLLSYDFMDDHWVFSDGQIDANSVSTEWLYGFDEELAAEQLPEIIANNCTENNGVKNIEIVNTSTQDGKTIVTVSYNSVQKPFLFKNAIELEYNATVLQGLQLGAIREISSDYVGIDGVFDEDISVNYNTKLASATPRGMSQSGTATVHLHINESGGAHLSGKIGTIQLDNSGTIEYPTGVLTLTKCQKDINVNYVLIISANSDIPYWITPSLTYRDGKLSGSVYCDSISLGVDDFSIVIQ